MTYHGPKVRLSRRLGMAVAEIPKHLGLKEAKRPGMHGYRQPRLSQYGMQLLEKQKVASYYNIGDAQLRRYMKLANAASEPSTVVLQRLVETRLRLSKESAGSLVSPQDMKRLASSLGMQGEELEERIRESMKRLREVFLEVFD